MDPAPRDRAGPGGTRSDTSPVPTDLPALEGAATRRTVVVPALDEVDAVDALAELARDLRAGGVAERLVLVDGGSRDGTIEAARAAGLEVVVAADRPPGRPVIGKGDSIWRVADLDTDVLVFRDADVVGVDADDLDRLARGAEAAGVALAKGRFERLQHRDGPPRPVSGRITEFVARPLLGLLAPDLVLPEPLSGQFAIRAEVLAGLPVVTRYGVDVGLALDVAELYGPSAVASVDLGSLTHRSKDDASLVPMAHDVAATILGRRSRWMGTPDHLTSRPDRAMMDPRAEAGGAMGGSSDGAGRVGTDPGVPDGDVAAILACAGPEGALWCDRRVEPGWTR